MMEWSSRMGVLPELRKLSAFLRRDALISWSYRRGAFSDIAGMLVQALLFYFLSSLVDTSRMTQLGGTRAGYMGFVVVGLTVASFYQVGVNRMMSAVQNERFMGTFETLLTTPTAPATLQLGFVVYDILRIPVRTAIFLVLATTLFGVDVRWAGLAQVCVIILAFLPFVWGLAAGLTAAVIAFRQAASLVGLANVLLVLGSGTYFPLQLFPSWVAATAALNPLAIALNGARAALLDGIAWSTTFWQAAVILAIAAVTWMVGTLAFQFALERERRTGNLGLY
jgi:ABC-type polysaccharide/polyol phosphate export permease